METDGMEMCQWCETLVQEGRACERCGNVNERGEPDLERDRRLVG